MIALAGSGCQAAALWVYDEVRRSLDEQLGICPCAELSAAQAVVLRQEIRPARPAVSDRPKLRAV
jgi:DNA-binding SARP family transcriptional activator